MFIYPRISMNKTCRIIQHPSFIISSYSLFQRYKLSIITIKQFLYNILISCTHVFHIFDSIFISLFNKIPKSNIHFHSSSSIDYYSYPIIKPSFLFNVYHPFSKDIIFNIRRITYSILIIYPLFNLFTNIISSFVY